MDYRKSNLIVCTMAERQRMLPKRKTKSSSRYKGVCWDSTRKMWRAGIEVSGSSVGLGFYTSEAEAARAYNKAAKKHFGEFAYHNNTGPNRERRMR